MAVPTLAVIIVSWNVRDLLRHCLKAVDASLAGSGIACQVVVVDNASSDGTPAMLRAEFPHVCLLEPGCNLGFAGGNNVALRVLGFSERGRFQTGSPHTTSLGRGGFQTRPYETATCPYETAPPPAYVLLLNPDTEPVGDALPRLVDYLDNHPDVVAVGPRLCYADGSVQSSQRRFPTRLTFFWESTLLGRLWPGNPWTRRYHCAEQADTSEQVVDWLVGAALLVRGAAIAAAGGLDERFFMYSEELEWQQRLQQATNGKIIYLPTAVVMHYEGRSSEQVPLTRHLHFQRSKVLLAEMWYGRGFAGGLRRFLWLCYLWELCSEAGKHLLGQRRTLRRERMRVYGAVLHRL